MNLNRFVTSVGARLADLIEFARAVESTAPEKLVPHRNALQDQHRLLTERLARAVGVEPRKVLESRLPWDEAADEVAVRRERRKRDLQRRRRESAETAIFA